jgi:hypothetical protein
MLSPGGSKDGLFWLAPVLYRLALGAFLDIAILSKQAYWLSEAGSTPQALRQRKARERQHMAERAVLRMLAP